MKIKVPNANQMREKTKMTKKKKAKKAIAQTTKKISKKIKEASDKFGDYKTSIYVGMSFVDQEIIDIFIGDAKKELEGLGYKFEHEKDSNLITVSWR